MKNGLHGVAESGHKQIEDKKSQKIGKPSLAKPPGSLSGKVKNGGSKVVVKNISPRQGSTDRKQSGQEFTTFKIPVLLYNIEKLREGPFSAIRQVDFVATVGVNKKATARGHWPP